MFWPIDLAVFYPLPPTVPWWYPGAAALLIAITGWVIWQARRQPYLVVGWFWFLITLVPVIGLVQVGMQAMADRYTYFPLIGIAIMLVWGGAALAQWSAWRRSWCLAAATVVLAIVTTMTWRQLHHWRSSYTLFSHAISITDNNYIAQSYLGLAYHGQKRYREAVQYYMLSLTVKSGQADTHHNLGLALSNLGEYEEAVRHFQDALLILPSLTDTRYRLALAYGAQGKIAEAVRQLELVILADPTHATGHYDLGVAYSRQGQHEMACQQFATALRLKPELNEAREGVSICRTSWGIKL
jgi:tetratricopeptide (TPR) repeat protein